jgi:hypothetical protein
MHRSKKKAEHHQKPLNNVQQKSRLITHIYLNFIKALTAQDQSNARERLSQSGKATVKTSNAQRHNRSLVRYPFLPDGIRKRTLA